LLASVFGSVLLDCGPAGPAGTANGSVD